MKFDQFLRRIDLINFRDEITILWKEALNFKWRQVKKRHSNIEEIFLRCILLALSTSSGWLAAYPVFKSFSVHNCTVSKHELCSAFMQCWRLWKSVCTHYENVNLAVICFCTMLYSYFSKEPSYSQNVIESWFEENKAIVFCKELNHVKDEAFSSIDEDISMCIVCGFDREILACMSGSFTFLLVHVAFISA